MRKLSADQETSEAEKEREKSKRRASRGEAMTVWEGEGEGEGVESAAALQAAMKELGSLRETRERTEEMVLTLVQQRDLYKAMLEEADITLAAKGSPSLKSGVLGSPQGPNGPTQSLTRYARCFYALLYDASPTLDIHISCICIDISCQLTSHHFISLSKEAYSIADNISLSIWHVVLALLVVVSSISVSCTF